MLSWARARRGPEPTRTYSRRVPERLRAFSPRPRGGPSRGWVLDALCGLTRPSCVGDGILYDSPTRLTRVEHKNTEERR